MASNSQKLTYYQRNRDAMLQRSKEYYENNKDKRKEYQRIRFHNMSIEERDKLNEYHRTWDSKLDDDNKNKMRKNALDRYYLIKAC